MRTLALLVKFAGARNNVVPQIKLLRALSMEYVLFRMVYDVLSIAMLVKH